MENTKAKMLLAALSQCIADRDEAAAQIAFILENGGTNMGADVKSLKQEFKKISQTELTMEAIQIYYASHCKLPEQQVQGTDKKGDNNDNNS